MNFAGPTTEVLKASAAIGVANEDCLVYDFQVRRFPELRQQILGRMIELASMYKPDMVFFAERA